MRERGQSPAVFNSCPFLICCLGSRPCVCLNEGAVDYPSNVMLLPKRNVTVWSV